MTQIKHTQICSLIGENQPYRNNTHPNLYPLAGDDSRLTYSNGAVQIRVGLELADLWQWPCLREEKNSININFLVRIFRGHSWPLRPDAQGSKSFSPPRGHRKTQFLVRTSTIFGADIHNPKGCRKTLYKNNCIDFLVPTIGNSRITFQRFILRELFLVIISSWFTSEKLWPNYFS